MLLLLPKRLIRTGLVADWRFDAAARNLLTRNQSNVEADLTGFAARAGATLTRDTTEKHSGVASLKVETPGVAASEGVNITRNIANMAAGDVYTFSAWVKGTGTVSIYIAEVPGYYSQEKSFQLTGEWQRISITRTSTASGQTSMLCCVKTGASQIEAKTYHVDDMQLKKGTLTDFVEGGGDTQILFDYSQGNNPVNLLLPNQADCCEDGTTTGLGKVPASVILLADNTLALHGNYSLRGTKNVADGSNIQLYNNSPRAPVVGGRTYSFSAWAYPTSLTDGRVSWLVDWFDASGTFISNFTGINREILPVGVWTRGAFSTVAPDNAAYASLDVIAIGGALGDYFNIDCMQINEGPDVPWQQPPNIGQLGSGSGSDTSDPPWVSEGSLFVTDDYITLPASVLMALSGSPAVTLEFVLRRNRISTRDDLIDLTVSGTNSKIAIYFNATNNLFAGARAVSGDTFQSVTTTDAFTDTGSFHYIAVVINIASDNIDVYYDIISPRAKTGSPSWAATAFDGNVGSNHKLGANNAATLFSSITVAYCNITGRALAPAELTNNKAYLKPILARRGIILP